MQSPPISYQEKWTTWEITYSTFGYILAFYCSLIVLVVCCVFGVKGVQAIKDSTREPEEEKQEEEEPLKDDAEGEVPAKDAEADSTNDAVMEPAIDPGMQEPVKDEMMM